MSAPRSIVTDIEGTTTSVRFVYDTLFPYARERIGAFVREHRADPVVAAQIAAIAEQAGGDSLDAAIATLTRWIDEDRKATPLKTLQGLIWAAGYADGTLRGHVYADAATTLRRWHAAGLHTVWLARDSEPDPRAGHRQVADFTTIDPERP